MWLCGNLGPFSTVLHQVWCLSGIGVASERIPAAKTATVMLNDFQKPPEALGKTSSEGLETD